MNGAIFSSIEKEIEATLDLGHFVSHQESSSFVSGLEDLKIKLDNLIKADPKKVMSLIDIFIAGCYEKADDTDDSSGNLGTFVDGLFRSWIEAAQVADVDPGNIAKRIFLWQEDDDYGFAYEIWKQVIPVLNVRSRAAYCKALEDNLCEGSAAGKNSEDREWIIRRDTEALKFLYVTQRDFDAFHQLIAKTDIEPSDCLRLAQILDDQKRYDEALEWVACGFKCKGRYSYDYELAKLKRGLLNKLGRHSELIEEVWLAFQRHPSKYTFKEIMEYVPKNEKAAWRLKAMEVVDEAELDDAIELLIELKEIGLLAQRVEKATHDQLMGISHYQMLPAAEELTKRYPLLAAKVYRALGMRILQSKKSKYYSVSNQHFEQAKRLYEEAGQPEEWQQIVAIVLMDHRRKSSFIEGFKRIAAGKPQHQSPTFNERINKRLSRYI